MSGVIRGGVVAQVTAALLIAAGTVTPGAAPALAQDGRTPGAASSQPPAAVVAQERAGEPMAFDIPAQPLSGALTAFGRQSGYQISVDHATLAGLTSKEVKGSMTPERALGQMLPGGGVTWRFTDDKSVVLTIAESAKSGTLMLDPVMVEGQSESAYGPVDGYVALQSATGTKTDTPLIATPRSISIVTADQIDNMNFNSVDEALRYIPGVAAEIRGNDPSRSDLRLRGFTPATLLDGMRGATGIYGFANHDTYAFERVEVLKGPASTLYGAGSPAGLVNLVTKRPTDQFLAEVEGSAGSFEQFSGKFDIGGPIDTDKTLLFRLTGLARDGNTQVDFAHDRRLFIAPAITWKPTRNTSFTVLTNYQKDDTVSAQFIPSSGTIQGNPNGRISRSLYVGEPSFETLDIEEYAAGYQFEHRFNDIWSVRNSLRYTHDHLDYGYIYAFGLQNDQRTLNRGVFTGFEEADSVTTNTNVQANFALGATAHTVLGGVDYKVGWLSSRYTDGNGPTLDAFDPIYGQPFTLAPAYADSDQDSYQVGVYGQDQIKLFDKLVLIFGGRHDWASTDTDDKLSDTTTKQNDTAFTGHTGIVYLFDYGIAPYFSYAESFEPVSGTDAQGDPFVPTTGSQYEAGVKYQPKGSNSLVTLSAFQITEQNILTTDLDNPNFDIQTGEVRSRGVEIEAKMYLFDALNILAGYSYTDAEVIKSNSGTGGNRPGQLPAHLASAWIDYTIPDGPLGGLGFGGGMRYIGTSYDYANTIKVPAVTLIDAAVHYSFSGTLDGLALAINASNLLDTYYISSCESSAFCYFGNRRVVIGSMKYRW